MRVILVLGIIISVLAMLSCGDSVTKATSFSQVVDAHFKYSDIDIRCEEELYYWNYSCTVKGKVTNNSGLNIRYAEFVVSSTWNGERVQYNFTLFDFTAGSTREFERWFASDQKDGDVEIVYDPFQSRGD